MTNPTVPDPIVLISGPPLQPDPYRCPNCCAVERYPAALPAFGVSCRRCTARISAGDKVVFASLATRLLALFLDSLLVAVPAFVLLLLFSAGSLAFAPHYDENSVQVTRPAVFWIVGAYIGIVSAGLIGYLAIGNAHGTTLGKRVIGLTVVRLDTGAPPGARGSVVRTMAQLLTISTLGIGYMIATLDRQRRTLHDLIAHTIVLES